MGLRFGFPHMLIAEQGALHAAVVFFLGGEGLLAVRRLANELPVFYHMHL